SQLFGPGAEQDGRYPTNHEEQEQRPRQEIAFLYHDFIDGPITKYGHKKSCDKYRYHDVPPSLNLTSSLLNVDGLFRCKVRCFCGDRLFLKQLRELLKVKTTKAAIFLIRCDFRSAIRTMHRSLLRKMWNRLKSVPPLFHLQIMIYKKP